MPKDRIVRRDPDDPVLGHADLLPDAEGLVVGVVDRDVELGRVEPEIPRQQLPGKGNGLGLEVVAKGKIPHHLEKRQMARGVAHIVEVIVLATGADAFLGRGGADIVAGLDPGEQILELHHARIGEHERRIVARHERRGRHDLVAIAGKEIEEGGADVGERGHRGISHERLGRKRDIAAALAGVHRRAHPLAAKPRPRVKRERRGPVLGPRLPVSAGDAFYISTRSSEASPPSDISKSSPCAARILSSISRAMSGFSFRNSLEFSRPWPIRSSP